MRILKKVKEYGESVCNPSSLLGYEGKTRPHQDGGGALHITLRRNFVKKQLISHQILFGEQNVRSCPGSRRHWQLPPSPWKTPSGCLVYGDQQGLSYLLIGSPSTFSQPPSFPLARNRNRRRGPR
ncbi:hypothetical protein AVEN_162988-1 [Araneus ventricosus]|uniref:Uncharacterized protein n=1 Tax=Araneus ventricosus TaxID=182803 RepID=A0A4Y2C189_ARAVE|nr:hypothetical protein AVEN_162988-1 [Araneus ventricosus]